MTPEAFDKACLGLPGATLSVQWGDDHVFKVGGKMFAVRGTGVTLGGGISFKASDVAFEVLTESGRAAPAPIWPAPSGCISRTWPSWTPTRSPTGCGPPMA